jgi:xylan 1,4-beta-xylosidase
MDQNGDTQVLLWDLTHPTDGKVSNQDFFFRPHPAGEKGNVTVRLKHLTPGNYRLKVYRIGNGQNDPYSRYLELGSPTDLSREAVMELKNLSAGKPVSEATVTVGADGRFETILALQENEVCFLSLDRE